MNINVLNALNVENGINPRQNTNYTVLYQMKQFDILSCDFKGNCIK